MNRVIKKRIGDIVNFKRGYDLPVYNRTEGKFPIISSSGVSGYHSEYKKDGEGVITGRYGTLGNIFYISGKYWPHNTSLYVYDFKGNYPKYVYFLMKSLGNLKTSDKSTVPGINRNDLHEIVVPYIEAKFQKPLADYLYNIENKIALNNRINAELEAMAKLIYDYWFVQFDFPDENGNPYKSSGGKMVWNEDFKRDIPARWSVIKLSEITDVSKDSVNPINSPDREFKHYSIPSFDELGTFKIEKGREIKSSKFKIIENDLLVSKLNPWFNRVIYSTDDSDLISSTEFVVWRTGNTALKNYLYMIARDSSFVTYCSKSATGTSNSHKRVNPTLMMNYKIVYDKETALQFGNIIGSTIKFHTKNQLENKTLTELRDWLLPMLMNGQVKVADSEEQSFNIAAKPEQQYGHQH
jgi:type I restriction enzyme, S subunit